MTCTRLRVVPNFSEISEKLETTRSLEVQLSVSLVVNIYNFYFKINALSVEPGTLYRMRISSM